MRILTARIRRMTGRYCFQFVSPHPGGYPIPIHPRSLSIPVRGGVPNPALDGGGTPIQPWMGGYPNLGWGGTLSPGGYPDPALDGGGTPTLDRGVPQPWMGGYPISRGVPRSSLGQGGTSTLDRGVPRPWMGGYPNLGRGVPHPMSGGVPPSARNSKHLLWLRGGRCASCVHAGGLSCCALFSV